MECMLLVLGVLVLCDWPAAGRAVAVLSELSGGSRRLSEKGVQMPAQAFV